MLQHSNVNEVVVFGIESDEKNGKDQEVCVWIELKSDELKTSAQEIKDFCFGKLKEHEIPTRVRFVKAFPHRHSTKYSRVDMRRIEKNDKRV